MSEMVAEADFRTWEGQQQLSLDLIDGRPVCRPIENQSSSRLARVLQLAFRILGDEAAVMSWIGAPQVQPGGIEPAALAADSEDRCGLLLAELARQGRLKEVAGG